MKRQTAIYIGIAIIIVVGVLVFATNKSSNTTIPESLGTSSVGSETTNPNATGMPATSNTSYTLADVQKHSTPESCWATINGNVYDLTKWINKHPGGPERIINLCGKDGTVPFNRMHGNDARPQQVLATFKIGTLSTQAAK